MEQTAVARNHNLIRCEVVTTYEQLLHTFAIRAICFMEEHGVTARQTFDGNDYQATHFIAYAEDEPIACQRVRWFRDFAKLERTGFRRPWRNVHNVKSFANFIFSHAARKGYDKVITHAQPKYALLWRRALGFKDAGGKEAIHFQGHEAPYVELVKHLSVPSNAITEQTEATVLFRTEGFWDAPSEFETAAL